MVWLGDLVGRRSEWFIVVVADAMGKGQPAFQEEWKMYRKKRRIVMSM
jgi:hypothetical protein